MKELRGYPTRIERVTVGGRAYELLMPMNSDALLDDPRVVARFERDEYMPYWGTLWPAALLLAERVATWEPAGSKPPTVLELGCGLGLVGLVAAGRGYRVISSDYDEAALAFVRANAELNHIPPPETRVVDWRATYADLRCDRILAADVLYEARNLVPFAEFVARHLEDSGFALVSDTNRSTADGFASVAGACSLSVTSEQVERSSNGSASNGYGRIYDIRPARRS